MDSATPSPVQHRQRRPRWLTALVVILATLCGAGIAVMVVRLGVVSSSASISGAIADGKRPKAPHLVDRPLMRADVPGLPGWLKRPGAAESERRILVVNMWASWCGPCREETPMLQDTATAYADRGVDVIGVNPMEEDAVTDARAFVREFDVTYGMVRARRAERDAWGVRGFPETFIVGRDGRIGAKVNGPIDEATLVRLLDRELQRGRGS